MAIITLLVINFQLKRSAIQYFIMAEIAEILGKNIKKLRKEKNWTQEYLAEQAGISVPFMTQIELARKQASLEVIEKIAKALNIPYSYLFLQDSEEDVSNTNCVNFLMKLQSEINTYLAQH